MPIARAALHTHPEPPASATAGAGLQTPRRTHPEPSASAPAGAGLQTPRMAAYLQSAAAVCIFAGDRVRLGDEHPAAGPSDATKKVDPLSAWYFMQMPQNVWYQFNFGN